MCQNIGGVKMKDTRQNADFENGRDTTGDFENETKAPICNNTGHQFKSVTNRNINQTEIPQHKTAYFNFCGILFSFFFWNRKNTIVSVSKILWGELKFCLTLSKNLWR